MARRTAANVWLTDPATGRASFFAEGDLVPDELAATVTNAEVWADVDVEESDPEQEAEDRLAEAIGRLFPDVDPTGRPSDVAVALLEQAAASQAQQADADENGEQSQDDGGNNDGGPEDPSGGSDGGDGGQAKSPRRRRAS